MYLNIDGFNKINDRIQSERQLELDNQRRAVQDARTAETFGRQKKQWGLDDAVQSEVAAQAGKLGGLTDAKGYDWRKVAGVPTDLEASNGLAAPINPMSADGMGPPAPVDQSPAGLASGRVLAGPTAKPASANPMDDELEGIKGQARLAAASRDPKMLAQAQAAFIDHKKRRTAMELSDYFDNASPEEMNRMAGVITADKTNKVKAVYDKDSGFTRLETEEGVQNLSRSNLKKYMIAKALGNFDGMAAVQQDHVARTDKDNATTEKITTINNQGDYRSGLLDAKQAVIDAKAAAGASGQPTREERLRYTSLFTEAGRRIGESQKALGALQKNTSFMRKAATPGTPQAQQLQELRDAIKSHSEERSMYQGLLAGSQSAPGQQRDQVPTQAVGAAGLSDAVTPRAPAAAPSSTRVTPAEQASRDSDRGVILERELATARQRLAQGDTRAQGDIESLTREIAGLKKTPSARAPAASASAAKPNYSNLWK